MRAWRGPRLDLLVAVCALLISTLAAGASYWQARVMETQTAVLQEQLGAQVWPYVSVSTGFDDDTMHLTIENDGLGPAILRSVSLTQNGVRQPRLVDFLHAALGPHLMARRPHGQALHVSLSGMSPSSVIRSGQSIDLLTFRSKFFARPLLKALANLDVRTCYCAIVPGRCWSSDTSSTNDPQAFENCPSVPNDLLRSSAADQLLLKDF